MSGEAGSDFEVLEPDWLDARQAQIRILSGIPTPSAEEVPTLEAVGRAIAHDLAATATLPARDNSAMDGYAVHGRDIAAASAANPVRLQVTGRLAAEDQAEALVEPGTAVRIMTGAPVPPGADSVVRVEDTDAEEEPGFVQVLGNRDRGRNIRPAGEDMRVGDAVLRAGESIHTGTVGVLYALGMATVPCARRPTVAILSTGHELRPPERYDDVRSGAGTPESNGPMLAAAVSEAGCLPRYLGIAGDDVKDIRAHLEDASDADVIITLGGASMGEADLVKRVLAQMSFELDFWRVRVRPGSPISFGHLPRTGGALQPVFGLPGNPASAFVTFELFVRPFLRLLAGHERAHRPLVRCVAGEALHAPSGLLHALRVRIDGTTSPPTALPTGPQGSGLVRSMSLADGLALIPEDADGATAGQVIDVMLTSAGLNAGDSRPPSRPT